MKYKNSF